MQQNDHFAPVSSPALPELELWDYMSLQPSAEQYVWSAVFQLTTRLFRNPDWLRARPCHSSKSPLHWLLWNTDKNNTLLWAAKKKKSWAHNNCWWGPSADRTTQAAFRFWCGYAFSLHGTNRDWVVLKTLSKVERFQNDTVSLVVVNKRRRLPEEY